MTSCKGQETILDYVHIIMEIRYSWLQEKLPESEVKIMTVLVGAPSPTDVLAVT